MRDGAGQDAAGGVAAARDAAVRLEGVGLALPSGRGGARTWVLADIAFTIPQGGFRWLVGPSGAGKTSLLRLIHLAQRPSTGRIHLFGQDIADLPRAALPALRRRIGVIFQDERLLPHLSVLDNVVLPLRLAGRPEGQIRADAREILRWMGMAAKLTEYPPALSGGERQRVAIARAAVTRPALLLADEPSANLDAAQTGRMLELLQGLRAVGTAVLVATHDTALLRRHKAPELRLDAGRLTAGDA